MGAISAGVPAVHLVVGPMMTGRYRGERLGACTDCRRFWAPLPRRRSERARRSTTVEDNLAVTAGTCAVMGTASTMACLSEALGMSLPGSAAVPAVHADRLRIARSQRRGSGTAGRVGHAPEQLVTRESIDNALRVLLAIGGSTNAVIHLAAIAGRVGLDRGPASSERAQRVHAGPREPEADGPALHGGFPRRRRRGRRARTSCGRLLNLECRSVTGETLEERLQHRPRFVDRTVIRSMDEPFQPTRRAARAVRQHRAQRVDPQVRGGRRAAVRARGASRRVHGSRRTSSARIDHPDLDVAARRRAGAAECRADWRRDAGGGLPSDPVEARASRREGHGPDLGRPHERHSIRHRDSSRLSRVRDRRSARARALGRSDQGERGGAPR